ncbi:DHH family phosphoesterase [Spiroplasma cantharicola]|uniref:Phosphoesterase RecJ domain-containing protein n=1 Tax=Spiroplasma cantharicola TaxID=362837 RepID=A0A0M4JW45_9MOLU|nr:bifunctional oligoribonuclease/PAP phosphatase NrnA [Spiroplasma cantharicola]ALD66105.1 phosphoesterase RecJ domain-containing protein [Spiroplasma cantharicola]
MFKKLIELINSNKKIILLRHIYPDFDAIGSQMSLYQFINDNFKNKNIKLGGDLPKEYHCIGKTQKLKQEDFKDALVIITDTAIKERIDIQDLNWLALASDVFKIDHHVNIDQYGTMEIVDSSYPATCELLTELYNNSKLVFSKLTAYYLFHGLITDTDRFMYRNVTARTFEMASILIKKGFAINDVYKNIYGLSQDEVRLKGYILSNYKISKEKIAYIILTKEVMQGFNIDDNNKISLWVNILGEIKDATAWVFFTQGKDFIRVEFRSNKCNVRDIAVKFGGGGHINASGAKLESIDQCLEVIKYFDKNFKKLKL